MADEDLMGRFWNLVNGLAGYFAVLAADELGIFGALAESGPARAEELAVRCCAVPSRLRAVLEGNVAVGALECRAGVFSLSALASTHLVPGEPGYLGPLLRYSPGPVENWPVLAATVRGAAPPRDVGKGKDVGVHDDATTEGYLACLARATFPVQLAVARAVVDRLCDEGRLGLGERPSVRVLDLGAGAAPWAVAVLERLATARAVVNDLPSVLPLASSELSKRGLLERAELRAGSYFDVPLPSGDCDLVVLGHVCRAEGDVGAAALIARAVGALAPGGTLVVTEYLLDDDLAGPTQAQLLGTTMVANTEHGATFTHAEVRQWLNNVGLAVDGDYVPVPPTTVVLARRS
jgi:SAM-dependent methyltransferase